VGGFDSYPPYAVGTSSTYEGGRGLAGLDALDIGSSVGHLAEVATIGRGNRVPITRNEHRAVRAGKASEVADVHQPGDQQSVDRVGKRPNEPGSALSV
jgi:hypothetical protein